MGMIIHDRSDEGDFNSQGSGDKGPKWDSPRKCKCGYIDVYSRGHVYYDVENRKHSWSECDPFGYSVERLDKMLEDFRNCPARAYERVRSDLWREIQNAMEWSRKNGYVQACMENWGCSFEEAQSRLKNSRTPDKKET